MSENKVTVITIEKGVEIPPRQEKRGNLYPFDKMEVGESFWIHGEKAGPTLGTAAAMYKRKNSGFNYTVRKQKDGARIWRIA
jgi:hypothetical protein